METGTLLHEIYVSADTSHLLRLTELMLEKGPEDLAMMVTKGGGDTLLNKLLKHYGSATPRERDQYVMEVRGGLLVGGKCGLEVWFVGGRSMEVRGVVCWWGEHGN